MQRHPPAPPPDPEVLSQPASARLLARASELDAARDAGSAVPDLRAAALEAGISARAFDAALAELAELQDAEEARRPAVRRPPRRRSRVWAVAAAGVALLIGALTASRVRAPAVEVPALGGPMIEEAMLLRCLSPGEAAELVRPLLRLPANRVVIAPTRAPRVLTIRATEAQLRRVRSELARYEGAGSPACATRPTATS